MGWQKEDPKEIKLTCTKEKLKPMRSSLKGISSPCKKILKRGGGEGLRYEIQNFYKFQKQK